MKAPLSILFEKQDYYSPDPSHTFLETTNKKNCGVQKHLSNIRIYNIRNTTCNMGEKIQRPPNLNVPTLHLIVK